MNISNKRRNLIISAALVSLACGLGGIAQAVAQNAAEPNCEGPWWSRWTAGAVPEKRQLLKD